MISHRLPRSIYANSFDTCLLVFANVQVEITVRDSVENLNVPILRSAGSKLNSLQVNRKELVIKYLWDLLLLYFVQDILTCQYYIKEDQPLIYIDKLMRYLKFN